MTSSILTLFFSLFCANNVSAQELTESTQWLEGIVNFVFDSFLRWGQYIRSTFEENPGHVVVETVAIGIILYLVFVRTYDPKSETKLTLNEEEALIAEWMPEPLVPKIKQRAKARLNQAHIIDGYAQNGFIISQEIKYLNLASYNFLAIAGSDNIKEKCKLTVQKYGVGSCGPRGFYGTIDTHLNLEKGFAQWIGMEDAILYSDGIACTASIIPSFAKKGDLIICDDAANYNIESGIRLSKANIIYFRHNDVQHLEQILKSLHEKDLMKPFKQLNRRFIIVEGLYQNRGDLAPLDQIVALKDKFKYRLILDDSMGVGVLGRTGKGSIEHWCIDPSKVDILSVTLDASIGSVGGICAGSYQIVDHQRLSGVGYVFSASSPPYTCVAALEALSIISNENHRSANVRENARKMRFMLEGKIPRMTLDGDNISPIILIRFNDRISAVSQNRDRELEFFEQVAQELSQKHQIIVGVSIYVPTEPRPPKPSLRILVSSDHVVADLQRAAEAIIAVINQSAECFSFDQEEKSH